MQFNYRDLNKRKLTHLLADDLFSQTRKMVFDSKSGKIIGFVEDRQYCIQEEQPEPEELKPLIDKQQLSLF